MNSSSIKSFILTKPAGHPRLLLIQPILAVNEPRISEGKAVNYMQGIVADNSLQIITNTRAES